MELRMELTQVFAVGYPEEVAASLDTGPPEQAVQVLQKLPPETAARVLQRMALGPAVQAAEAMEAERVGHILVQLTVDAALSLLRGIAPTCREAIIGAMPGEYASVVNRVIGFPSGTAGALMDPRMLALPFDMAVDEALKAARGEAEHAHYNIYVVDRDHMLIGVVNLREMLQASPRDRLDAVMRPAHHRLDADADGHMIIAHRGWREVYSLPVVDRRGRYLGAIRYRTFRRLEDELRGDDIAPGAATARALGDLFWTGVGGVIDTIATVVGPKNDAARRRSDTRVDGSGDRRDELE
jgi:magnesium transporter